MAPVKAAPKATDTAPNTNTNTNTEYGLRVCQWLWLLRGCSPEHDLLLTASQAAAKAAAASPGVDEAGFDLFLVVQFMSEGEAAATPQPVRETQDPRIPHPAGPWQLIELNPRSVLPRGYVPESEEGMEGLRLSGSACFRCVRFPKDLRNARGKRSEGAGSMTSLHGHVPSISARF